MIRLTKEEEKQLSSDSARLARELANLVEDALTNKKLSKINSVHTGLLQAFVYAQLSSWFMAAHLAVCKEERYPEKLLDVPRLIDDIVASACIINDNFNIVHKLQ